MMSFLLICSTAKYYVTQKRDPDHDIMFYNKIKKWQNYKLKVALLLVIIIGHASAYFGHITLINLI